MATAFVIMQIGNRELDDAFEKSILPAILSCGLEAKRVDKHNEGGLLKSEIIQFINISDIIIADLTNERPNCYLEVGYAMGMDKFRNLILTARKDHFPDSPNFVKGGPKIHFDLAGYDILSWESEDLECFRTNLEKRIKRRLAIIKPKETTPILIWDSDWIKNNREQSEEGMKKFNIQGATEIKFALHPPKITSTPQELVEAAKNAIINTFGWPIGVFLEGSEEFTPKPRADGIWNEVYREDRPSYDYWAIKRNGDFYSLVSYFEDSKDPGHLFIETRIIRATEVLLYCGRLYSHLGVDQDANIKFALRFIGLKNRILTSAHPNRRFSLRERKCSEESIENEVSITYQKIESDLVAIVKKLTSPLFTLFDFAEFGDDYYEEHVNKFVNGNL